MPRELLASWSLGVPSHLSLAFDFRSGKEVGSAIWEAHTMGLAMAVAQAHPWVLRPAWLREQRQWLGNSLSADL